MPKWALNFCTCSFSSRTSYLQQPVFPECVVQVSFQVQVQITGVLSSGSSNASQLVNTKLAMSLVHSS